MAPLTKSGRAGANVPDFDDWGTTLDGRTGLGVGRSVHTRTRKRTGDREDAPSAVDDGVCLDLDEPAGIEESLGLRRRPCP
jgi:hypothetical protein